MPDRVIGAALFADISGFTPLTEALAGELGARRGAEELVANLNRILAALIQDLHEFEGDVIYFSGDAITCWIDGDDGRRATACALAMQERMAEVGLVTTAGGTTVELALKVAVAVGSARRFVVGDPEEQLIEVLAGSLVDDVAIAESAAGQGEVVLDRSAVVGLGDRVVLRETRTLDGREFGVVDRLDTVVERAQAPQVLEPVPEEIARQWLLPTVYDRLATGGSAMFAELRTVFPMFIRFGGIDYDGDPDAAAELDGFIRRSQHILAAYGGNLLQLTLGDKGAYLYAVFGSPRAYEDDALRAVSAAWELQSSLDGRSASEQVQIGISTGRVLSGTCGHPLRRTFACLGDPVNLAARLMSKAGAGETLVTGEVVAGAGERFTWDELEPMQLKGKSATVAAFSLTGARHRSVRRHERYPLPMVGREAELAFIDECHRAALDGRRNVVGIMAEAGLGKSRLVAEVVRSMRAAGHRVVFGESQAFGTNTSYLAWREPWHTIFELDDGPEWTQIARVERVLAAVDHKHARRAPLLGSLLGLDIPDNEVTATFDAKLRKASLESLLADALRAEAGRRPLVIVLEDCHWIDEASLDLLEVLVRETAGLPVLVIAAYRPEIPDDVGARLGALADFDQLVLEELTPHAIERVTIAKINQQYGAHVTPAAEVVELIVERSQGNPFYIEELVDFFHLRNADISDPASVDAVDLPGSLQSLVLSRIDTLEAPPRRTLKVASVIGREFEAPALPAVYPDLGTRADVAEALDLLGHADLVTRDREEDDSWLFRHAVTRDVAYESIPFALRATLHEAAGTYLESRDQAGFNLDFLAHHYWHSENLPKKIEYQRRAGDAAKAAYANAAAIEYFERLASLVEGEERRSALLKLGEILELVGNWERAETVELEALELAEGSGDASAVAWCEVALAEVARKQGRYDEGADRLERAGGLFDESDDRAGKGRVLHLGGTLAAQRGDLDAARSTYERSLALRQELGDLTGAAAVLSNLGVVAEYSGDLDGARRFHERALEARTAIGDRWAIAVSNTNLGMIAVLQERFTEARDLFESAMGLNSEVGDSWMVAVSHNNLGNAHRGLGDVERAWDHYAAAAEAYRAYADRWAAAFLLEDIAVLAAAEDRPVEALELLGAADRMRTEIDTPRSDGLEADLRLRVVERSSGLVQEPAIDVRARGGAMDFDTALASAIACCRGVR
jgi:class 3 adenylate cyclase/tetratricopeptide (TPR) repeat protein